MIHINVYIYIYESWLYRADTAIRCTDSTMGSTVAKKATAILTLRYLSRPLALAMVLCCCCISFASAFSVSSQMFVTSPTHRDDVAVYFFYVKQNNAVR